MEILYNKKDFMTIGGFDDGYDGHWGCEDIDFGVRAIIKYGYSIYCIQAWVDHTNHDRHDPVGDRNSKYFARKHKMVKVGGRDGKWITLAEYRAQEKK